MQSAAPFAMDLFWPVVIFFARICDVSLGTLRILFISRGFKKEAVVAGFFEVLIWVFAITHILQNLDQLLNVLAYASGYAMGNLVGIVMEERLSIGTVMLRIFTPQNGTVLTEELRKAGFGLTRMEAQGLYGPVEVLMTVIDRRDQSRVVALVRALDPNAVYTVEDVRQVTSACGAGNGKGVDFSSLIPRFPLLRPGRVRVRI